MVGGGVRWGAAALVGGGAMDEVHRKLTQGFQVDGASLRGFVSSLKAHFDKAVKLQSESYKVCYGDGGVQYYSDIDDILSLPNVGRKEISEIEMVLNGGGADNSSGVVFSMQKPVRYFHGEGSSISYDIVSNDVLWNKAVQADCDEFSAGVKKLDVGHVVNKYGSGFIAACLVMLMVLMLATMSEAFSGDLPISELKSKLSSPDISAGQAIFEYAQWEQSRRNQGNPVLFMIPMFVLIGFSMILRPGVVGAIFRSHIFYIGGMVNIINQRRATHAVVWISVVLAVIIGLSTNYISKILFG